MLFPLSSRPLGALLAAGALILGGPESRASQDDGARAPSTPDSAALPSKASSPQEEGPPRFGAIDPKVWVTKGSQVPDLELPLIDGSGVFDLASLRGKKVLLIQFASW